MFEVEFRCHFNTPDDAYQALPFMRSCLTRKAVWTSDFYGLELFQSGQLLRTAVVSEGKKKKYYMAWKGPDTGHFCNIRREIEENITDSTNSPILKLLGGREGVHGRSEVIQEFERLGYHRFMSWSGIDLSGLYQPHDVKVKMMSATAIKWPIIVEIEKIATTENEALDGERQLYDFSREFKLQEYIFKEEPPTLLYASVFGSPDNK
jgi:adenylate cyclase class IV